jgi:hypothetical protein
MCRHKLVEMPLAHSGKVISREFILQHGIASMKIPFDLGSFRKLKERAEGAKQTAYCVDVIFNPFIIQMFMDDSFNETMKEYRPFVINLVLGRIEASIGVKLSTQKVKLVKKYLYKDGEGPNSDEPRDFTELPQEIEAEEETYPQRRAPAPTVPEEPLIQDVTAGKKKPAVKKGFLNKGSAELYPEGSKEGVLPENAGDPMGWMPKGLRKTCKIVDCNSPEYQAQEKQRKETEKQNKSHQEFNDMLTKDLGKWAKNDSVWSQDLPDGAEPPPTQKYEVNYSRFDKIDDVVDKPTVAEERDWFCDADGNVRSRHTSETVAKAPATQAQTDSGPAIKKGFFDDAKAPLYPKGSEQRAPTDEAELLKSLSKDKDFVKDLEKMMGEEDIANFMRSDNPQEPEATKPSVVAKVPERKAASFTLENKEDHLELVVAVPGLDSMQGVDLDVMDRSASMTFPSRVALKPLKVELPVAVVPISVRAKFSKKTHQVTVKLPLA